VKIESLGREGDGIARVKNFVIIIPDVSVGDFIKVKINKVARRVAFGEVMERLEGAPEAESEEPGEEIQEEEPEPEEEPEEEIQEEEPEPEEVEEVEEFVIEEE